MDNFIVGMAIPSNTVTIVAMLLYKVSIVGADFRLDEQSCWILAPEMYTQRMSWRICWTLHDE